VSLAYLNGWHFQPLVSGQLFVVLILVDLLTSQLFVVLILVDLLTESVFCCVNIG
jgi:hypothetical protein